MRTMQGEKRFAERAGSFAQARGWVGVLATVLALTALCAPGGAQAVGAGQAVQAVEVEVNVRPPGNRLVRQITLHLGHAHAALPGLPLTLNRVGDRFTATYHLPATLTGELRGSIRVTTTETGHQALILPIRPIALATDGPTVARRRTLDWCRLEITAVAEETVAGTLTRTPVQPDVTFLATPLSSGNACRLVALGRNSFPGGQGVLHVPVDAFALPSGSGLRLLGTVRHRPIAGGLESRATTVAKTQAGGTVRVELVFRDWLREIRDAMREVFRRIGLENDVATDTSEVEVRAAAGARNVAEWFPLVTGQLGLVTHHPSHIDIQPGCQPAAPNTGETICHEFTHELLYQAGWQPDDPPIIDHRMLEPASATTLAWEEALCHQFGGWGLAEAIQGAGGVRHTHGQGWIDDLADSRRGTALLWEGRPNGSLPTHPIVRQSGNWIEGVIAAALHELYLFAGLEPEPLPERMLRGMVADLGAFCDAVDDEQWTAAAFLTFLRNRAMPAPAAGNWGRIPDQIGLWYHILDPSDVPDLEHLVEMANGVVPTGDVPAGQPASFEATVRAFRRLATSTTYDADALRLRLYEGTTQLGQDVGLQLVSGRAPWNAAGTFHHTFTSPGPATVHLELWTTAIDGTPRRVARAPDVTVNVVQPPLVIELSRPFTRPGDTVEATAAGGWRLQRDERFVWSATDGLDLGFDHGRDIYLEVNQEGTLTLKVIGPGNVERASTQIEVKFPPRKHHVVSGTTRGSWTFVLQSAGHGATNIKDWAIWGGRWNPSDATGMQLVQQLFIDSFEETWEVEIPVTVDILGDVRILGAGRYGGSAFTVYLDPSYPNWIYQVQLSGYPRELGPNGWHFFHHYKSRKVIVFKGIEFENQPGGPLTSGRNDPHEITYQFDIEHYECDEHGSPVRKREVESEEHTFAVNVWEGQPPAPTSAPVTVTVTPSNAAPTSPEIVTLTAVVQGAASSQQPLDLRWSGVDRSQGDRAEVHVLTTGDRHVQCAVHDKDGKLLATGTARIQAQIDCDVDLHVRVVGGAPTVGSAAELTALVRCAGGAPPPGNIVYRFEPHPEIEFEPHEAEWPTSCARFLRPGPTRMWVAALVPDGGRLVTLAESAPFEVDVAPPHLTLEVLPPAAVAGTPVTVTAGFDTMLSTEEVELAWSVLANVEGLEETEGGTTLRFTPKKAGTVIEVRAVAFLRHLGIELAEAAVMIAVEPEAEDEGLRARAERGDVSAMVLLGRFHFERDAGEPDRQEAVRWFQAAADRGSAQAKRLLALCVLRGHGIASDGDRARELFRQAAAAGDDHAPYVLGYFAARAGEQAQALAHYREAAARGGQSGMRQLGVSYELGEGVAIDYAEARKWYLAAAEAGHARAQQSAGRFLLAGLGGPVDRARGLELLEAAASRGLIEAQLELAEALGVTTREGLPWLRRAALGGEQRAAEILGLAHLRGVPGTVEPDPVVAARWLREAAESPFAGSACLHLGDLHRDGLGAPRSLELARHYYTRATEGVIWWEIAFDDGPPLARKRLAELEDR